jgi:hypothetical protein
VRGDDRKAARDFRSGGGKRQARCRFFAVLRFRSLGQDQQRLPGGRLFRLRRVTWKSTPSNQRCLLLVGSLLRRDTLTPTTLRGPAPNGHPCPDGALAASMPLGPLRVVCVRPAPKSRLAVFEPFAYEDQKQIKSRSKASRLKPVLRTACAAVSGTGFSREEASAGACYFADQRPYLWERACSRMLLPLPLPCF